MKESKSWNEGVPYEVRMKHIIQSYRNDQEKWGKMEAYAKQLEAEVIRLRNVLVVNGFEDTGNPEDAKPAKVIRELKAQLDEQENKGLHRNDVIPASCRASSRSSK